MLRHTTLSSLSVVLPSICCCYVKDPFSSWDGGPQPAFDFGRCEPCTIRNVGVRVRCSVQSAVVTSMAAMLLTASSSQVNCLNCCVMHHGWGCFTVTSINHLFEYCKHTLVSRRKSFGVVSLFCDCKIGFDVDSAILKWVNLQKSAAETQAIISIIWWWSGGAKLLSVPPSLPSSYLKAWRNKDTELLGMGWWWRLMMKGNRLKKESWW